MAAPGRFWTAGIGFAAILPRQWLESRPASQRDRQNLDFWPKPRHSAGNVLVETCSKSPSMLRRGDSFVGVAGLGCRRI